MTTTTPRSLDQFLVECCESNAEDAVSLHDLFACWKAWTRREAIQPGTQQQFVRVLRERDAFEIVRTLSGFRVRGLSLSRAAVECRPFGPSPLEFDAFSPEQRARRQAGNEHLVPLASAYSVHVARLEEGDHYHVGFDRGYPTQPVTFYDAIFEELGPTGYDLATLRVRNLSDEARYNRLESLDDLHALISIVIDETRQLLAAR